MIYDLRLFIFDLWYIIIQWFFIHTSMKKKCHWCSLSWHKQTILYLVSHQSGDRSPNFVIVHGILWTEENEQETNRKWNFRQIVQNLALGQADECHGGFFQVVHTADQYGKGLRVLGDPLHDVLNVLLPALIGRDPNVDPVGMLKKLIHHQNH